MHGSLDRNANAAFSAAVRDGLALALTEAVTLRLTYGWGDHVGADIGCHARSR
jgi:hypothetical protein